MKIISKLFVMCVCFIMIGCVTKNISKSTDNNSIEEVTIDVPNVVDFSHDKIKGDIKSDKIASKVDPSDLAKKLKKLKK